MIAPLAEQAHHHDDYRHQKGERFQELVQALVQTPKPNSKVTALTSAVKSQTVKSGTGVPAIDRHLGGGLAWSALHEFFPTDHAFGTASCRHFVLALLSAFQSHAKQRPFSCLWFGPLNDCAFGGFAPRSLADYGFESDWVTYVASGGERDTLWALEEAIVNLRQGSAGGGSKPVVLVAELADVALKQTHRLNSRLNAADNVMVLLLRRAHYARQPSASATSSLTRWRIGMGHVGEDKAGNNQASAHQESGQSQESRQSLDQLLQTYASPAPSSHLAYSQFPRSAFDIELFRNRGGAPGSWKLEWSYETRRFTLVA